MVITKAPVPEATISGATFYPSKYYRGRYECLFYGRQGPHIKQWIRDHFGSKDDMVYAFQDYDVNYTGYDALITKEQLLMTVLKWS